MSEVTDPRTGEVLNLTGQRLDGALQDGWTPVDPNELILISGQRGGNASSRTLRIGSYIEQFRQTGGSIAIPEPELGMDILARENTRIQEERHQADVTNPANRAATTALSALDMPTFGLGSTIGGLINEEGGERFRELRAENPWDAFVGDVGGLGLSLMSGGAAAGAAQGTSRAATGLLSMAGPGALSMRAGQAARGAAGHLIRGSVRGGRLSARGGRNIANVAEQVTADLVDVAGMHVMGSIRNDPALHGESLASDAGISVGLGLGIETALMGGGRFGRLLRQANGAMRRTSTSTDIVNAGRLAQVDANLPPGATSDDMVNALRAGSDTPQVDRMLGGRIIEPLQDVVAPLDAKDRMLLNTPQGQRQIATSRRNISDRAAPLAKSTNELFDVEDQATRFARSQERLEAYSPHFRQLDTPETRLRMGEQIEKSLGDARRDIDHWAATTRISTGAQRRLKNMAERISRFEAKANLKGADQLSSRELFAELHELDGAVGDLLDPKKFTGPDWELIPGDSTALVTVHNRIRNDIVDNPGLWGSQIVDTEKDVRGIIANLIDRKSRLWSVLKEKRVGAGGKRTQVGAAKMDRLLKKIGKVDGRGDEEFESMIDFASAAAEGADELERLGMGGTDLARRMRAAADSYRKEFTEAATDFRVFERWNGAVNNETRFGQAGALGAISLGGLVGMGVAGPVGAGAAVLGGLMLNHVFRPGSSAARLGAFRLAMDRLLGRRKKAISQLRTNLTSGRGALRGRRATSGAPRALPVMVFNLQSRETQLEDFQVLRDDLLHLQRNPEVLIDRLAVSSVGVEDMDQELAQHYQTTMLGAYQHLLVNMPNTVEDPLGGILPPSRDEMDAFAQRYAGVEDPWSVLEDLANGRVTLAKADAVRTVYPAIHSEMMIDIAELLAELDGDVPYTYKVHFSNTMGGEFDDTMTGDFVMTMQNAGFQTEQQRQAQQGVSSPRRGNAQPQLVTSTETELQRATRR